MTKIYHVSEFDREFVYTTTPPALKNIANQIGAEFVLYGLDRLVNREIDRDSSNDAVWYIEAAYTQRMSLKELRTYIPNGKIVCCGGDSKYFLLKGIYHPEYLEVADLLLDMMSEVVDFCRNIGLKADHFLWTAAEEVLNQFPEYVNNTPPDFDNKNYDFICLMTVENQYRHLLKRYLNESGYTAVFGAGPLTKNMDEMVDIYRQSWFTLGSSSPSWTIGVRTQKGWRDALGIALGALLIYDDFIEMKKKWGGDVIIPFYKYEDFRTINKIADYLKENREDYLYYLDLQRRFLRHHTIDRQLMRLFRKYDIISGPTVQIAKEQYELPRV